MQMRGVLAVHLQKTDADRDPSRQKPFGPRDSLFERRSRSFKCHDGAIPSLASGELVGTVDAEGVGVKRRLSAGDSFEGADRDVRRTGLRERLKGGDRDFGVGVRDGCLRKASRAGGCEKSSENNL